MPVFDFSDKPVKNEDTVCTYTAFQSNAKEKTPEEPILVLETVDPSCAGRFYKSGKAYYF